MWFDDSSVLSNDTAYRNEGIRYKYDVRLYPMHRESEMPARASVHLCPPLTVTNQNHSRDKL